MHFLQEDRSCFLLYAAQIKEVEHLNIGLGADSLEGVHGLEEAVDPARSFLLTTGSFKEGEAVFSNSQNTVSTETYLAGDSDVKTKRILDGLEGDVQVHVVEFQSGVRVYSGVSIFAPETYIKKIKIPDIDRTKAFPLLQVTSTHGEEVLGSYGYFQASFSDSETLKIERNEPVKLRVTDKETGKSRVELKPMPPARVAWQVVEMEGIQVESGIAKIPHFGMDTNAYLLNSITDMNRAVLLFYVNAAPGTQGLQPLTAVRGSITEKDSLSFFRGAAGKENGEQVDIFWFLIQFDEGKGSVQKGTVHFEASENTKTVPVSRIDRSRSFPLVTFSTPGKGEGETEPHSILSFSAEILDSENLLIKRSIGGTPSVPADVEWQLVEFAEITIDEPAQDAVWTVGKPHKIVWQHSTSALMGGKGEEGTHLLDIYLSLDGGKDDYPYIIKRNVPASSRQFPWTIPEDIQGKNPIGRELRIKIVDLDSAEHAYYSGTIKVIGSLDLITPNGEENWGSGSEAQEIRWRYTGDIGTVSLYYDTAAGLAPEAFPETNLIATVPAGKEGEGVYFWNIPPELHSYEMKIKIVQESNPEVFDESFSNFSVLPSLEMLQPDGGNVIWSADSYHFIQWKTAGIIKHLNLYYAHGKEGEWQLAAKNIEGGPPGIGGFRWLVPKEAIGDEVRIKLSDASDPKVTDEAPDGTDQNIKIISWVRLKESRIENEVLHVGEVKVIEWEYGGQIDYFNLDYSRDGGSNWNQIAYVSAAEKIYHWTVPDDISAAIRLRISHVKNPELNDMSDTTMEIKGSLKLLKPEGGETWFRDRTEREIEWFWAGRIGSVSIYYDEQSGKGGFPPHQLLAGPIDSKAGRVVLKNLPDLHSDKIRLRIIQDSDPALFDTAPGDLTILPVIEIKEPIAGSSVLFGGKAARIAWSTSGTIASFSVFYKKEQENWQMIRADVPGGQAGTYTYQWNVPEDLLGSRVYFRVESASEPKTMADTTDGPGFVVESWINLSDSLLDHLSYVPGQPLIINWEFSKDIRFVMLHYSLDKGASWQDIAVVKADEGFYKWTVPAEVQGEMLISVRDLNRKQILDISPTLKRHRLPLPEIGKPGAAV